MCAYRAGTKRSRCDWGLPLPSYPPVDLSDYVARLEERVRKLEVELSQFATETKSIPVGGGFTYVEGAGSRLGTDTLAAGTKVVAATAVTANSRIFLTSQVNGVTGALRVSARTAGVSFTVTSSVAGDAGLFAWLIVEPT